MAMTLTDHYNLGLWQFNDYPFAESSDQLPDGTPNTTGKGVNDNWRDIDTQLWNIHEGLDQNLQTSKPASIIGLYGQWAYDDTGASKKTLMLEGVDSVWLVPNSDYLATETYVDQAVQGIAWQDPVLDKDLVTSPAPVIGERYIIAGTGGAWSGGTINDIAECTDDSPETWDFQTPAEGWTVYVDDENKAYRFNGSSWVTVASIMNHNDLANIFGDPAGYHLNQADYDALSDVNAQLAELHDDGNPTFATADITGKLTVGGLIDPTGIGFSASASDPLGALYGMWLGTDNNLRPNTNMNMEDNLAVFFGTSDDARIVWNIAGLLMGHTSDGNSGNCIRIDPTITYFNVFGGNFDFTVEGENLNRIWYLDASADSMGIRTNTPQERLHMAEGNMLFNDSQKIMFGTGKDIEGYFNPTGYFQLDNTVGNSSLYLYDDGNSSLWNTTNDVGVGVGASGAEAFMWALRGGGGYSQLNISDSLIWLNKAETDTDVRISGDTDQDLFYADASADKIGIGKNNPATILDVDGTVTAIAFVGDGSGITGIIAGDADQLHVPIRKASVGTILAGKPCYLVGYNIAGYYIVEEADANVPAQMPAILITEVSTTNSTTVFGAVSGTVVNVDTSSWGTADILYVANGGGLTNARPTGDDDVQKVGQVGRSHASLGTILVQGAGRVNDLPQIAQDKVWLGNASGVPIETSRSGIDDTALHDNVAGEIHAIASASSMADDDEIVFEDADDSWNKKRIKKSDVIGGGLFGADYQTVFSSGRSTTTSSTFQDKITLTTPALTGTYMIAWSWLQDNPDDAGETRIYNVTDTVAIQTNNARNTNATNRIAVAGHSIVTFTGSAKTFKAQYRNVAGGNICGITDARLTLWRVA